MDLKSQQENKNINKLNNKNIPIGEVLLQDKMITEEQLQYALKVQKSRGKRLGDMLIELGYVKEDDIARALGKRLKVDYADLSKFKIKLNALDLLTKSYSEKNKIIPIECNERMVVIATSDPMNFYLMDDIKVRTGRNVKFVLSTKTDIERSIAQYYDETSSEVRANINQQFELEKLSILNLDEQLKDEIENSPIVKFVNTLIFNAISSNASDIHIEPRKNNTKIRMRIDGQLIEKMEINIAAHNSLVTRIKIMAKMDISEKRIPQDGRIEIEEKGRTIDLRVSSIPTVFGEKIVIRVLGGMSNLLGISNLGLTARNSEIFNKIIKSPNGIILVCGPTGSGKTTTLYSILKEVNKSTVNIVTIEDPVEYRLDDISQVQVNNKTGLTFASGLRSILRQDPDIIMLGEIRDTETAEIAVKSAITGHLVLSTIHTNSAAGTIPRLIDMNIEPFLLSSAVVGIVAQRLVKRLCPKCKFEYTATNEEIEYLGIDKPIKLYKATGCEECGQTGYKGRLAIHEVLPVTTEIKKLIGRNANEYEIEEVAIKQGMTTLRQDGTEYVIKGIISIEELMKATYSV
ncbi:GspE/PulE family protein [uncultured Tyzzerella sp.]|uniref:GspE/PulE family protein n=1 Tax=uncultured Tyzzerella sp. TaxID=2321398 RepID=UPI002942F2F4|nr:GspE/PulE family protein [uncultured Tyzzerella sp.]